MRNILYIAVITLFCQSRLVYQSIQAIQAENATITYTAPITHIVYIPYITYDRDVVYLPIIYHKGQK